MENKEILERIQKEKEENKNEYFFKSDILRLAEDQVRGKNNVEAVVEAVRKEYEELEKKLREEYSTAGVSDLAHRLAYLEKRFNVATSICDYCDGNGQYETHDGGEYCEDCDDGVVFGEVISETILSLKQEEPKPQEEDDDDMPL